MAELLLELVLYVLLELVGEALVYLPLEWTAKRTTWPTLLLACFFLVLGLALGWTSALAYPRRFAPGLPVTGVSVFVAPVLAAAGMYGLGRLIYPNRAGRPSLFSFWFAFDFAFGAALARFLYFY